jgi:hypothetical protein
MPDTRVHCPSCHRNRKVIAGRYDEHHRRGRQGGRCGQSGELVVAVKEAA